VTAETARTPSPHPRENGSTPRRSGVLEVLRNRFTAIVNEMGFTLLQTGFTVFIKETGDFSCALVTPSGEVFQAPTRIGMIRIVGMNMRTAVAASAPHRDGDIWITNDPWTTGGMCTHLPDLYVWKPIYVDGRLVCFAWAFIHVTDIGGRVAGSILPTAKEVYEEGLIVPPTLLYDRGVLNRSIVDLIKANCRIPDATWGDIKAAIASLHTAERRIREVVARYGVEMVLRGQEGLIAWAEERARAIFREVPDGSYSFTDYVEGPGNQTPFRLALRLEFKSGSVTMDFTGTDAQVQSAYNIPTTGQGPHHFLSTGLVTFLKSLDPQIPYNGGLVRPIHSVLPEGSVVNPRRGAAIGVRAATMHRVYDLTMGCLGQALPEVVPAAGGGQGAVLVVAVPTPSGLRLSVVQPLVGGSGGRPSLDGVDGNDITVGTGRNIPCEVIEQDMPILIEHYGLRSGSAGAGRQRGGLGIDLELRLLAERAIVTCRGLERYVTRPWGRRGGHPGTLGHSIRDHGAPDAIEEGRFDVVHLKRGDRLRMLTQGGGGYGDPLERDPQQVLVDVRQERVTREQASDLYGVIVRAGRIDEDGTREMRARLRRECDAQPDVSFGAERVALDSARLPTA
jgi:N-methylhydantoinase B